MGMIADLTEQLRLVCKDLARMEAQHAVQAEIILTLRKRVAGLMEIEKLQREEIALMSPPPPCPSPP